MTTNSNQPKPFNCYYGFIVEGSTDKYFLEYFLKKFIETEKLEITHDKKQEIAEVKTITKDGGKDNFNKINCEVHLDHKNLPEFLILINDVDGPKNGGYETRKEQMEKLKKEINHKFPDLKIIYYIFPFNNNHEGQLEDLFLSSLKSDYENKLICIDEFQKCLEKTLPKPRIDKHKIPETKVNILLSAFGTKMNKAVDWIDYSHESLSGLKGFLGQEVFKIKSYNKK